MCVTRPDINIKYLTLGSKKAVCRAVKEDCKKLSFYVFTKKTLKKLRCSTGNP